MRIDHANTIRQLLKGFCIEIYAFGAGLAEFGRTMRIDKLREENSNSGSARHYQCDRAPEVRYQSIEDARCPKYLLPAWNSNPR